jgi:hypothetical protein
MRMLCATHGHCFDGLASAVIFLRAAKKGALGLDPSAPVEFAACGYGPRQPRPETVAQDASELAILDYRYSTLPELKYYFDHHRTAFANTSERNDFQERQRKAPERFRYDETASSCTKLLAEHLGQREALDLSDLRDLICWADIVDSARFESPKAASNFDNPVMRLVSVVEQYADAAFLRDAVPILESSPLLDFCRSELVERRFASLRPHQEHYRSLVKTRGTLSDRVAFVDMTDEAVHAISKFAVYAEFPGALYSVVLARLKSALRISVGYNPWCGMAREHDIGTLCAGHGGGGHPVVGGIAFPLDELERARRVASGLATTLAREGASP